MMRSLTVVLIVAGACVTAGAVALARGPARSDRGDKATGSIAFMRPGQIGESDLWVVRPNGSKLHRLTVSPPQRSDYNPDWSPDGSRVIFERRVLDGTGDELYTVRRDGAWLRRLTKCDGDCWSDNEPDWSADGRRITFGRATGPKSGDGPSKVAIYVMNADGTGIRQVSTPESAAGEMDDHYPTWSPDGTDVRVLHLGIPADSGVWAPDGKAIAFRCQPQPQTFRLCTSRLDGGALKVFAFQPLLSAEPVWGPSPRRHGRRAGAEAETPAPADACISAEGVCPAAAPRSRFSDAKGE
jgi:TolB protein